MSDLDVEESQILNWRERLAKGAAFNQADIAGMRHCGAALISNHDQARAANSNIVHLGSALWPKDVRLTGDLVADFGCGKLRKELAVMIVAIGHAFGVDAAAAVSSEWGGCEAVKAWAALEAKALAVGSAAVGVKKTVTVSGAVVTIEDSNATHNADFTEVNWFDTRYSFNIGNQAKAVSVLWEQWGLGGFGLHEKSIGEKIGSEAENFRLLFVFRGKDAKEMHPAWGKMIVTGDGKGKYKLQEPKKRKRK